MKRSQLLESFGDGVLTKLVLNLGVAGEIELTDDDPPTPEHHIATFHGEGEFSALKFVKDGKAQVILTVDPSSFVIDGVSAPPEEPATEPMIGPDGESLLDDEPSAIDTMDAAFEPEKPKRGKKAAELKRCPWPACRLSEGHDGDHDLPIEDPNA